MAVLPSPDPSPTTKCLTRGPIRKVCGAGRHNEKGAAPWRNRPLFRACASSARFDRSGRSLGSECLARGRAAATAARLLLARFGGDRGRQAIGDRKSVVLRKSGAARVDLGGRRPLNKKKTKT